MFRIKAITLWGPWAQLIPLDIKHYETRSWATKYRGPLAIHAAKKLVPIKESFGLLTTEHIYIREQLRLSRYREYPVLPTGAIVATCNLIDCIEIAASFILELSPIEKACGNYTLGRYAWILEDVSPLASPVPATGKQGLWNWEMPEGVLLP